MPAPGDPTRTVRRQLPRPSHRETRVTPLGPRRRTLGVVLGAAVVAHGLVTTAIWVPPAGGEAPFDASHSWLLGDDRAVPVVLGILAGLAFAGAGVGALARLAWWPGWAVVAGLAGAVLMVLWFNPWLSVGLVISVAVLVAGIRALVSS